MAKKGKGGEDAGILVVAVNKQARRDYEIIADYEAGIALLGSEVKSVRAGGINLKQSYVKLKGGEAFLVDCHIAPNAHSPQDAHLPTRERKLLLNRRELDKLIGQVKQQGMTLIPLRAYFKDGRLKIEFGVGKGKKHHDKRQDLKSKEAAREMARVLKRG